MYDLSEKPDIIKERILDFEKRYAEYLKLQPVLTENNFCLYPEDVYSIEYYLLSHDAICLAAGKSDLNTVSTVKNQIEEDKSNGIKPKDSLRNI